MVTQNHARKTSRWSHGATLLCLGILVALVLFDNQLERVPFLYSERSIWIRATVLFPVILLLLLFGLPWRSKDLITIGNSDAPLIVRFGALVLGAAGMAWVSIGVAVWLASISAGPISEERYRIDNISCLRDLCQIKMQSKKSMEPVTLPLPLNQVKAKAIEVGGEVITEGKSTIFGTVIRRIERKSDMDSTSTRPASE